MKVLQFALELHVVNITWQVAAAVLDQDQAQLTIITADCGQTGIVAHSLAANLHFHFAYIK